MSNRAELPILPCAFTYDGTKLEDKFDYYRTLTVEGRDTTSLTFETSQVNVGTKISEQKITDNTLKVNYIMRYEDIEEVIKLKRDLKNFLYRSEDVELIFDDDPQMSYRGRLSKFNDDTASYVDHFTGSFEIYCSDPLKYSREIMTDGHITINSPIETTPSKIVVKLTQSSSLKITNNNSDKVIKITNTAIYSGNVVTFDFEEGIVLVNGKDKTAILDLESDFENFFVKRGDIISCNSGKISVYCKEVSL